MMNSSLEVVLAQFDLLKTYFWIQIKGTKVLSP